MDRNALVGLTWIMVGCSGKGEMADTAGFAPEETCESQCTTHLPEVEINMVDLVSGADGTSSNDLETPSPFGDCDDGDAISDEEEWPCVVPNGLNDKFVGDDPSNGDPVCLEPVVFTT